MDVPSQLEKLHQAYDSLHLAHREAIEYIGSLAEQGAIVDIVGVPSEMTVSRNKETGGKILKSAGCRIETDDDGRKIPWQIEGGKVLGYERDGRVDFVNVAFPGEERFLSFPFARISEMSVISDIE